MPYMSVSAIDSATDHITTTYSDIAQLITLPENSVEGRAVKAMKVAGASGENRTGVLFLGGTHARELINPELVVGFALRLCEAYANNTGLAFGPKTYTATTVKMVVDGLDIFMVPLVNPDGRNHCLVPGGNPMWRKNRSNHPGHTCPGVDLNRNYDFLWSSGIGTSSSSCSNVYKGPGAFSEPETRNVRWMIDEHSDLTCMIDIHSYSELVLYPWGDDDNQTTDPNQNFQNPAFDGMRGVSGSEYAEFTPASDLDAHVNIAERVRDGIAAVRGRTYTVQASVSLYPTSATTHDYAYARNFVETGRRRILAFTLETARQFQPPDAEKVQVIEEVSAGLMECLLETLCPAETVQRLLDRLFPLQGMRMTRDKLMMTSASGRRYNKLWRIHSPELVRLVTTDKKALKAATRLLRVASRFVKKEKGPNRRKITRKDIKQVAGVLSVLKKRASKPLRKAISEAQRNLKSGIQGKTLKGVFKHLNKNIAAYG